VGLTRRTQLALVAEFRPFPSSHRRRGLENRLTPEVSRLTTILVARQALICFQLMDASEGGTNKFFFLNYYSKRL
jgi:hypothetical protein